MYNANCLEIRCIYPILSIAWIHNYNPNLVICTPPFLKYATKVKLSTGAGLLVRDGTRHPLKMVIEIDGIWRLSQHQKWLFKQEKEIKDNQTVISCLRKQIAFSKLTQKLVTDLDQFSTLPRRSRNCSTLVCPSVDLQYLWVLGFCNL
jgi:hypothetical protein